MGRFPVASKDSRRVLIVHHTHWDREWYQPFGSFQFRLLKATLHVLDLLERGEITRFLFDGQTVILDDLASILSDPDRRRLERAIAHGGIDVGPWYVLPDEFLVSGEALIRNLQCGITAARESGTSPMCLYLPDLFGHVSQIPQLAGQFGLTWALIFRGAPADRTNVVWHGADGTQVNTHVLPRFAGYYNPVFNGTSYVDEFDSFLTDMISVCSPSEPILLLAGADHTVPPTDWRNKLDEIIAEHPDLEAVETGLQEALRELEPSVGDADLYGEQRDNRKAFLLSGILSSRQYLKRLNRRAEERLSGVLEPLTLWEPEPALQRSYIDFLWKELLKNQPHDSIGGCSVDQVHRTNVSRYEEVLAGIDRYIHDVSRRLVESRPDTIQPVLTLWNLLPWRETLLSVESVVTIPKDADGGGIALLSGDTPVEVDILSRWEHDGFFSEMEAAPNWTPSVSYRVVFELPFDGMQARSLAVTPATGPVHSSLLPGGFRISNEALVLTGRPDGTIQLRDRRSGGVLDDALCVIEEEDSGDSYTSVPAQPQRLQPVCLTEAEIGSHVQRISARYSASAGGSVELFCSLRRGEPFLRVRAVIENRSTNRRYQIRLKLPQHAEQHYSDTPFDIVRRTNQRNRFHWTAPQTEAPEANAPTASFVWSGGIAMIHDGLHEYEFVPSSSSASEDLSGAGGAIYLTLLRGTGMLSKGSLPNRGGGAGPHIPTPDGQCLGTFDAELAIAMCERREAPALSRRFLQPVISHQGTVPVDESCRVSLDNRRLIMSACYRMDDRLRVLRLWNSGDEQERGVLRFPAPVTYREITLEEERTYRSGGNPSTDRRSDWATKPSRDVRVWLAPKQIYTIIYEEATP